jgi:hypothetical protein
MGEADQLTSSNPDIAKMTQSGGTDSVAGSYFCVGCANVLCSDDSFSYRAGRD